MGAAGQICREMKVEEEDQEKDFIGVTEPAISPEIGPREDEEVEGSKVPYNLVPQWSFREFDEEHNLTHGESSFDSMDSLLIYHPYNVRSAQVGVISHHSVLKV